jgi:hypothetical protein
MNVWKTKYILMAGIPFFITYICVSVSETFLLLNLRIDLIAVRNLGDLNA